MVIAQLSSDVHRHDRLSPFGHGLGDLLVIHLEAVAQVNEHDPGPDVSDDLCRGRVGVRRGDDFISRPDAERPEGHFHGPSAAIVCHGPVAAAQLCDPSFKLPNSRPVREPPGVDGLFHLFDLSRGDVWRRKLNHLPNASASSSLRIRPLNWSNQMARPLMWRFFATFTWPPSIPSFRTSSL